MVGVVLFVALFITGVNFISQSEDSAKEPIVSIYVCKSTGCEKLDLRRFESESVELADYIYSETALALIFEVRKGDKVYQFDSLSDAVTFVGLWVNRGVLAW